METLVRLYRWDNLLGVILFLMLLLFKLFKIVAIANFILCMNYHPPFYTLCWQQQQHAQWHYWTDVNSNPLIALTILN